MKISEIIMNSGVKLDHNFNNDVEVTGLAYDSRKVLPGNIFFAINEKNHSVELPSKWFFKRNYLRYSIKHVGALSPIRSDERMIRV